MQELESQIATIDSRLADIASLNERRSALDAQLELAAEHCAAARAKMSTGMEDSSEELEVGVVVIYDVRGLFGVVCGLVFRGCLGAVYRLVVIVVVVVVGLGLIAGTTGVAECAESLKQASDSREELEMGCIGSGARFLVALEHVNLLAFNQFL